MRGQRTVSKEEITVESYKTKMGQKLCGLFQQYDEQLCKSSGMLGMVYKMIHGRIPDFIKGVDENHELQVKIRTAILDMAKALEEDVDKTGTD